MSQDQKKSVSTQNNSKYDQSRGEPLAIVGIGCRLPGGVDNPEQFWQLVHGGVDGVIDIPAERWDAKSFRDANPDKAGKMRAPRGGFLKRPVDLFDASFFGMSPNEAARLDPQQRMLLEIAWEALEDAGQRPSDLAGSLTGVFIGGFMLDSLLYQLGRDNINQVRSHTATGMTMTMLSARLAYYLDLRGPTITVDTACSSSLVALHYACNSVWSGESDMVLAGGVNLMLTPAMSIALAKGKLTSPDGRCKTFDASANGYGRGEGAGIVVIKTLSKALADNDVIYATIRGTAVNQDGHSDGGITNPSKDAQIAVLRAAYARAGVPPNLVHYVEAHGTGTIAGDTTETAALGAVLGVGRAQGETFVAGSVKSNVGHLEGAAGVTGLIKAALTLHREQIAPNIHFNNPNPEIPFAQLRLRVATKPEAWERGAQPRFAGVNSFGYGGTNAHVVLEEAPPTKRGRSAQSKVPWLLPLSARSEGALKSLATLIAERLEQCRAPSDVEDLIYSVAARRDHHDFRVAVLGATAAELTEGLRAYAAGTAHPSYAKGHVKDDKKKLAWVFTGMGPQWWGMGRELMQTEPVFKAAVEELDAKFKTFGGWSFVEELARSEDTSRMERTEIAMSCNFAIQVGLAAVWRAWGVNPDVIVGHSVGEMGSAYASGGLSLEDGATVAYHRSHIMQKAAGTGRMLATGLSLEDARTLLRGRESQVSVAAVNSPMSITLAGDATVLEELAKQLESRNVFQKFLRVEVPYHSPQMDPLKPELEAALKSLHPAAPSTPLYSTVTTEQVTGPLLDNRYWLRNMRESVFFSATIEKLLDDGVTHFLEVGPHAVLGTSITETSKDKNRQITTVPSLLRQKPERHTMLLALRQLYVEGISVDWKAVCAQDAQFVRLPTYPWQRERHWVESKASAAHRLGPEGHPLIGQRLHAPVPTWEAEINDERHPYMVDHSIGGAVLFPASGYLETAHAALHAMKSDASWVLRDVKFSSAFLLGSNDATYLRTLIDEDKGAFALYSTTSAEDASWTLNSSGQFQVLHESVPSRINLDDIRRGMPNEMSGEQMYADLKRRGYDYGPTFRQVQRVRYRDDREFVCDVEVPPSIKDAGTYVMHPATLDACLHASLALLPRDGQTPYLPVGVSRLVCRGALTSSLSVRVRVTSLDAIELSADITICSTDGRVLVEMEGMRAHAVGARSASLSAPLSDWLYTHNWQPLTQTPLVAKAGGSERWLVLGGGELAQAVATQATRHGVHVTLVDNAASEGDRLQATLSAAKASKPTRIVNLCDTTSVAPSAKASDVVGIDSVVRLTQLLQHMSQVEWNPAPQFVEVTRGAQHVGTEHDNVLARGAVAGFMRTAMNEHVEYRAKHIDLAPVFSDADAGVLIETLLSNDEEIELALRDGKTYVRRFEHAPAAHPPAKTSRLVAPSAHGVALLEGQVVEVLSQQPLGPHDVEIEVKACGARASHMQLVAGRIRRVGGAVHDLAVGADVVARTNTAIASVVRTDAANVLPRPKHVDEKAAAALEALCTAHQALSQLARLGEGDFVAIHDDARGLGNAVAQVARRLRARAVVLTQGDMAAPSASEETWLRVDAPETRLRVRALTGGRGADLVICTEARHMAQLTEMVASDGCIIDLSAGGASLMQGATLRGVTYVPASADGSRRQTRAAMQALQEVLGPMPIC